MFLTSMLRKDWSISSVPLPAGAFVRFCRRFGENIKKSRKTRQFSRRGVVVVDDSKNHSAAFVVHLFREIGGISLPYNGERSLTPPCVCNGARSGQWVQAQTEAAADPGARRCSLAPCATVNLAAWLVSSQQSGLASFPPYLSSLVAALPGPQQLVALCRQPRCRRVWPSC